MVKISDLLPWDAAEFLRTPEAQAEYIALALADRDAEEIRLAYETVARARRMHGGPDAAPQSGERSTRQRD